MNRKTVIFNFILNHAILMKTEGENVRMFSVYSFSSSCYCYYSNSRDSILSKTSKNDDNDNEYDEKENNNVFIEKLSLCLLINFYFQYLFCAHITLQTTDVGIT